VGRIIRDRCPICILGLGPACPCTPRGCELVNPDHADFSPAHRAKALGQPPPRPRAEFVRRPLADPPERPAPKHVGPWDREATRILFAVENCEHATPLPKEGCSCKARWCKLGAKKVTQNACLECQSAPNL
jgi:hypothetical protein